MNCPVLIPAYHPDTRFPELAERILALDPPELVVVDDGSPAECTSRFERVGRMEGVTLLRHSRNRGKGAALKTGLSHLRRTLPGARHFLLVDADGQHLVEDMALVAEKAAERAGVLVIGARKFDGPVPIRSRVGNGLTRALFNTVTGLGLTDTQSGLRAVPSVLVPGLLELATDRYDFEMDMLFLCRREQVPVVEVPIRTIYVGGNSSSHFNPVVDSFRVYRRLLVNTFVLAGTGSGGDHDGTGRHGQ